MKKFRPDSNQAVVLQNFGHSVVYDESAQVPLGHSELSDDAGKL